MNPTKEQLQDPEWWKDNAPEGATHFHPDHNRASWCWVKVNDHGSFYSYYKPEDPWEQWDTASEVSSNFVKRPTAAGWDGKGLPPIGAVCECKVSHGSDWVKCEVVAHKGHYAIAYVDENTVMLSAGIRFRPIRTPEQIAEEERQAAVREMSDIGIRASGRWAEAIYEAGYRNNAEVLTVLNDLAKAYRQAAGLNGSYDKALLKAEKLLSK